MSSNWKVEKAVRAKLGFDKKDMGGMKMKNYINERNEAFL
jgi:hypothetical protein